MRLILLFVKYPEAGRVKTRLAKHVGDDEAVQIYRRMVAMIAARLPRDVPVALLFDPPEREAETRHWLAPHFGENVGLIPQAAGDLGDRLREAFHIGFSNGYTQIAAIGSDCIEITPETFSRTWSGLEKDECVIGPCPDGGYYLIALKQNAPDLFNQIEWSTERTFAQTLQRAEESGLNVCLLPLMRDVDTVEDAKFFNLL